MYQIVCREPYSVVFVSNGLRRACIIYSKVTERIQAFNVLLKLSAPLHRLDAA